MTLYRRIFKCLAYFSSTPKHVTVSCASMDGGIKRCLSVCLSVCHVHACITAEKYKCWCCTLSKWVFRHAYYSKNNQ